MVTYKCMHSKYKSKQMIGANIGLVQDNLLIILLIN